MTTSPGMRTGRRRRLSTLPDVEARREKWAAIFADAQAKPTSRAKDVIPPDPHRAKSVLVTVRGPESWSWYWPTAPVDAVLQRAAKALRRLSAKDAPFGVYQVTVNGTTREVVRSAREDV